jgi:two-component system chemotaxis response regulator CheB
MVSTTATAESEVTILALERGAVDFVSKPSNIIEAKGESFRKNLLGVLNTVVRTNRTGKAIPRMAPRKTDMDRTASRKETSSKTSSNKIIALACSTGGPKALQSVIPYLPKNLNAPMVLVQHMPAGFTKSMADRLNEVSEIQVKEAEDGDVLRKGHVYVAPGGRHMEVVKCPDGTHKIRLNDMPAIGGLRPCANITYDSLCDCGYDQVVCVVLTGMGADGTNGIVSLSRKKPVYVIAQDAASCVVYGMPKAIAESGLVNEVVPLTEISKSIIKNVGVQ